MPTDLERARELLAQAFEADGNPVMAAEARAGEWDGCFTSAIVAAIAEERGRDPWQPIETLSAADERGELKSMFLCWSPCDGPHLFWLELDAVHHFEQGGKFYGVFTAWMNAPDGPSAIRARGGGNG